MRRSDLAEFLRARRAAVAPEDAGLAPGGRRRTPGLRREEVALLAGVSVSWYTWLEQGRPINASADVLDAVARVLRLDPVARNHLFELAGHTTHGVTATTADVTRLNGGGEMVRVREGLIPMLRLHDYHGVEARAERLEDGIAIVVEDQECFCLFVDEVIGQRQTVIKGLPAYLGSLRGVSGCSILSDGDISLILDVSSIEGDLRASPSRGVGDE